jgi:3-oxoacyl-(acyl-carrier-protein) synthase
MSAPGTVDQTRAGESPTRGYAASCGVVATVAAADLPDDLKAAAKAAGAPRRVTRFLDGMALPAFVAGTTALDAVGVTDGERCGLFTVSGWDPDQHQPDIGGESPSYATVARHYITTASPTAWLRKMVNNTLCQLSLTRNLRGPNNHVVGGQGALAALIVFADQALTAGVADHVLIVAYDAPPGHESDHEIEGHAAAVVLGPAGPGATPLPAVEAVGTPASGATNGHEGRAVDALEALISATRSAADTGTAPREPHEPREPADGR